MLNQINEGTGKEILEAFGGTYPAAVRAAMGDRITDETYQDILTAIEALVAGGGGGGAPTIALGLTATGDGPRAQALQLTANLNQVTSGVGEAPGVVLPGNLPNGSLVSINVNSTSLDIHPQAGAQIDSAGADQLVHVNSSTSTTFFKFSATQWYTVASQSFLTGPPP